MSAAHPAEDPRAPVRGGPRATVAKVAAAVAVVAVLAFGASEVTKGGSSAAATAPGGAQTGQPGQFRPQMGTTVTGATLTKLTQVATAKYPGTVEHAMKLSDGSYEVHVIRSGGKGEVHVLVSRDFKVTGTRQGGPGAGGPPSGTAPNGTTPPATSGSSTQS